MIEPERRRPGRPRKSDAAGMDTRERVMDAAQGLIQGRGYTGCSIKDVAEAVGLRTATIHHHFPTKGDLGAAVARRYREAIKARLAEIVARDPSPAGRLRGLAGIFRGVLETENRLCLCAALGAEADTLPPQVRAEVEAYFEDAEAWLSGVFSDLGASAPKARARAYLSILEGAMLVARARRDIAWFDATVAGYLAGEGIS